MQAVLLLHGRGLKPNPETLRSQWLARLPMLNRSDGQGPAVGMITWADVAPEFPPTAQDIEWVAGHLVGRAFREIDGKPGLGHDDNNGPDIGRGSADDLVQTLAGYFRTDPAQRNAIRARVREAIQHVAQHVDRILLLTNDLGAVIAYEVLTHRRYGSAGGDFVDLGDDTRAKISLVTMGAPLGWVYDAELTHYIRRSSKTYPRALHGWVNVWDDRDPFAAPPFMRDPTLADEYTTFEYNPRDHSVQNQALMPNSVYGYLETQPVQAAVAAFIEEPVQSATRS
jgi:hypothetical protein